MMGSRLPAQPADSLARTALWWAWLGLVAASAIWSKLAGAAWTWIIIVAIGLWLTTRADPDLRARSRPWQIPVLVLCLLPLLCRLVTHTYWHDSWEERHYELRMAALAVALVIVSNRLAWERRHMVQLLAAITVCAVFACLHAWIHERNTTANAIAWATAIGMLPGAALCLWVAVFEAHPDGRDPDRAPVWMRHGVDAMLVVATACAVMAVLLSGSRGAYPAVLWLPLVLVVVLVRLQRQASTPEAVDARAPRDPARAQPVAAGRWMGPATQRRRWWVLAPISVLAGAVLIAVLDDARLYRVPAERISLAVEEARLYYTQPGNSNLDTSVGSRLALIEQSVTAIREKPWMGWGQQGRTAEIQRWMQGATNQNRYLGHNQNEWLHAAMDHGVLGFMAVFIGWLAWLAVAWRMWPQHRVAAVCLLITSLQWTFSSLFNVNSAHNFMGNFYGLMLACMVLSTCTTQAQTPPVEARA